jgi:diguanylate cyclase (GGDEF)-like protein/PAS domain S-box-containing protein
MPGVRAMVLFGGLATALLFSVLGGFGLWQSHHQYEQRAQLLTQNLASATERSLYANIEKIDVAVGAVVHHLEQDLADGQLDKPLAEVFLRSQISNRPELDGIRVVDATGLAFLGPEIDPRRPVNVADRPWFITQREQPQAGLVISAPLQSRITGQWVMSFSRRYVGPDGEFAGVVTAAVPLTYFNQLVASVDVGRRGTVVLRDEQLRLITRVPPVPGEAGVVGSGRVTAELKRATDTPGWVSYSYFSARTPDGVARTYTAQRIKDVPMVLVVGVAEDDYLADWYREVQAVIAFCGCALLLYGVGSWFLLRALSQNREARQRIDLLAKVFEHSGEAIVITDQDNRIIAVNPAFVRQTGYGAEEVLGRNPKLLASGRTQPEQYAAMWDDIHTRGLWRGELWDRAKDGSEYPKWMSIAVARDAQGRITHHIGSFVDMTELKQAEERILHLAHHDTLTKLPNRVHLQGRLEQAMASARRQDSELAMLFIDMDRFKNINDTLGHHVGDGLLVEVAQRLRGIVRDSDIVSRLGGDEFVLVLTNLGHEGARAAASVAAKVRTELSRPYLVDGHELHSTPSIGIGIFPSDGEDSDTLMKNADTAMYHAKSAGRDNYQFFTAAMNQATAERLSLEIGLRTAIERNELFLQYQPQVDMASGRVVGVEALVRWQHPERGLVPPLKFIPVAEETGQIEAIGSWVLDQALAQVARWRADGLPQLRVAVNMSAHQLRGDGFVAEVAQGLQRHGLPGEALELEVTESVAMRDPQRTGHLLRQLRALGVALAIDDFGTGYSSLAYLKQLPLSCLKLDRSFVMDIEHDPNDAAISAAAIQLAHSLGLAVVAEGVENTAQMAYLRNLHCDLAQGYFISRPMAADACGDFMHQAAQTVVESGA